MLRSLFLLLTLLLSFFSKNLAAIEVKDLYQATVNVDSQASAQREQAIKSALAGVFLKVGGKQGISNNPVLKKAQKNASRYVSQYRYQLNDEQLSLVVHFNEDKVNQLFKQANLALWGSLRPQVLLWLVDEQGNTRQIVADSDSDSVSAPSATSELDYDAKNNAAKNNSAIQAEANIPQVINTFSELRGLPIIMPLMDLTDSEQVSIDDFWDYYPEQVKQASLRYFADTVVVMRVSDSTLLSLEEQELTQNQENTLDNNLDCGLLCQQQDKVQQPKVLDWRVYSQGSIYFKQYRGLNKVELINQGLSDITELIYQSYALLDSASNDFVIEVKNVTSLENDMRLFNFLKDLSAVNTVTLMTAQADKRQFKLELTGSKTSFLASLKLNDKLTQVIEPQVEIEPQIDIESLEDSTDIIEPEDQQAVDSIDSQGQSHTSMKVTTIEEDTTETNFASSAMFETDGVETSVLKRNYLEMNIPVIDLTVKDESETKTSAEHEAVNKAADKDKLTDDVKDAAKDDNDLKGDESEPAKPQLVIAPTIPVFYWEQG